MEQCFRAPEDGPRRPFIRIQHPCQRCPKSHPRGTKTLPRRLQRRPRAGLDAPLPLLPPELLLPFVPSTYAYLHICVSHVCRALKTLSKRFNTLLLPPPSVLLYLPPLRTLQDQANITPSCINPRCPHNSQQCRGSYLLFSKKKKKGSSGC